MFTSLFQMFERELAKEGFISLLPPKQINLQLNKGPLKVEGISDENDWELRREAIVQVRDHSESIT